MRLLIFALVLAISYAQTVCHVVQDLYLRTDDPNGEDVVAGCCANDLSNNAGGENVQLFAPKGNEALVGVQDIVMRLDRNCPGEYEIVEGCCDGGNLNDGVTIGQLASVFGINPVKAIYLCMLKRPISETTAPFITNLYLVGGEDPSDEDAPCNIGDTKVSGCCDDDLNDSTIAGDFIYLCMHKEMCSPETSTTLAQQTTTTTEMSGNYSYTMMEVWCEDVECQPILTEEECNLAAETLQLPPVSNVEARIGYERSPECFMSWDGNIAFRPGASWEIKICRCPKGYPRYDIPETCVDDDQGFSHVASSFNFDQFESCTDVIEDGDDAFCTFEEVTTVCPASCEICTPRPVPFVWPPSTNSIPSGECFVDLKVQLSRLQCVYGSNYGCVDAETMYVDRGCRATFTANNSEILCESRGYEREECKITSDPSKMTNCVKVTTGAEYGYIFVEMVSLLDDMDTDHNEYIDLVPWQRAAAGEIIFEGCMGKKFQSIRLINNANIPWSGFIEYRETKNDTYVHMECSNCTTMAGTANHLIMVGQTIDNPINGSTICEYGCSFKIPLDFTSAIRDPIISSDSCVSMKCASISSFDACRVAAKTLGVSFVPNTEGTNCLFDQDSNVTSLGVPSSSTQWICDCGYRIEHDCDQSENWRPAMHNECEIFSRIQSQSYERAYSRELCFYGCFNYFSEVVFNIFFHSANDDHWDNTRDCDMNAIPVCVADPKYYIGCYINEGRAEEIYHGHIEDQTIEECQAQSHGRYFGLEDPRDIDGALLTQCLPLVDTPDLRKDPNDECELVRDSFGNRLGYDDRLAVYRNSESRIVLSWATASDAIVQGYMKQYTEPERINRFISVPLFTGSFGSGMASWLFHCDAETQIRFGVEYSTFQNSRYFLNIDEGDSPTFQFWMARTKRAYDKQLEESRFHTSDNRAGIHGMYYEHISMTFEHTVSAGTHWMNLIHPGHAGIFENHITRFRNVSMASVGGLCRFGPPLYRAFTLKHYFQQGPKCDLIRNDLGDVCTKNSLLEDYDCPVELNHPLCPGSLIRQDFWSGSIMLYSNKCVMEYFVTYTCQATIPSFQQRCEDAPGYWVSFFTMQVGLDARTCEDIDMYYNSLWQSINPIAHTFVRRVCPKTMGTCDLINDDLDSFDPDHIYKYRDMDSNVLLGGFGCGPYGKDHSMNDVEDNTKYVDDATCRCGKREEEGEKRLIDFLGQCAIHDYRKFTNCVTCEPTSAPTPFHTCDFELKALTDHQGDVSYSSGSGRRIHGTIATFTCEEGLHLTPNSTIQSSEAICDGEEWRSTTDSKQTIGEGDIVECGLIRSLPNSINATTPLYEICSDLDLCRNLDINNYKSCGEAVKREMLKGVCRNKFFVDDLKSTSKCFCTSDAKFFTIRMNEMQSDGFHLQLAHCQPPPTPEKGESVQMLYREGQDAEISCKSSYKYQDGSLQCRFSLNQPWTGNVGKCVFSPDCVFVVTVPIIAVVLYVLFWVIVSCKCRGTENIAGEIRTVRIGKGSCGQLFGDKPLSINTLIMNLNDTPEQKGIFKYLREGTTLMGKCMIAWNVFDIGTDAWFCRNMIQEHVCIGIVSAISVALSVVAYLIWLSIDMLAWQRKITYEDRNIIKLRWGIFVATPLEDLVHFIIIVYLLYHQEADPVAIISLCLTVSMMIRRLANFVIGNRGGLVTTRDTELVRSRSAKRSVEKTLSPPKSDPAFLDSKSAYESRSRSRPQRSAEGSGISSIIAVAENLDGSSELQPPSSSFMANETPHAKRSAEASAMLSSISVASGSETTSGPRSSQVVQAGANQKEIKFKESDGFDGILSPQSVSRGPAGDELEINVEVLSSLPSQNGGNDFDDLQFDDDQTQKSYPEKSIEVGGTFEEDIESVSNSPDVQGDADSPFSPNFM